MEWTQAIRVHFGCEDPELVCAVALGYPAETPEAKLRKTLDEILIGGNKNDD